MPKIDVATAVYRREALAARSALRMIGESIEDLFGPVASLESEQGALRRGPEYRHRAESIVDALKRVSEHQARLEEKLKQLSGSVTDVVTDLYEGDDHDRR